MWLVNWYKKNSTYINAFLITAVTLGVISGVSCLLFPTFLSLLASIPLLAFLSLLAPPVSSLIMSVLTTSIAFGLMALGAGLVRQSLLVSRQIKVLFDSTSQSEEFLPASNSHALMQPYLKKEAPRYRKDAELEDDQVDLEEENIPNASSGILKTGTPLKPIPIETPLMDTTIASFIPSC